jgi:hypothetical protein
MIQEVISTQGRERRRVNIDGERQRPLSYIYAELAGAILCTTNLMQA